MRGCRCATILKVSWVHRNLGDRLDIEHGGKIVLPPSAIEDLASQEFGDVNNFDRAEDTAGEF